MIFIVEDDQDIRGSLVKALKAEGFDTLEAANGEQAIEKLRTLSPSEYPSCILLDLMMPVMDGMTFIDTLRKQYPQFSTIPIVIHTAKGSGEILAHQYLKNYERLHKPADLDVLYSTVHKYESKVS